MKIEAETFMEYLDSALSEQDTVAMRALLAGDPELQQEEKAFRRLHAAERLARVENDSLPLTFEHSVMRRVRVAPPPRPDSFVDRVLRAFADVLEPVLARRQYVVSGLLSLLVIATVPFYILESGTEYGAQESSRELYSQERGQPYTRLVNAVTARIPQGFRAVSIEVAGWAMPGDSVDVVWLYHSQKKSTVSLISQNVQVLSTERDSEEGNDATSPSTVTLLVPEIDAGKIQLASSTGQLALSIRSAAHSDTAKPTNSYSVVSEVKNQPELDFLGPDGQVERYIMRDGRLVPRI